MTAQVDLPATAGSQGVFVNDQPIAAHRAGAWWSLDEAVTGRVAFEVR